MHSFRSEELLQLQTLAPRIVIYEVVERKASTEFFIVTFLVADGEHGDDAIIGIIARDAEYLFHLRFDKAFHGRSVIAERLRHQQHVREGDHDLTIAPNTPIRAPTANVTGLF